VQTVHLLTGDNSIDGNKLGLDHFLQVSNFMLQKLIMIQQTMAVILKADEIFKTQGQAAPGMGFKLGQINQKITARDGFWNVKCLSKRLGVFKLNRNMLAFIKIIGFDGVFLDDISVAGIFEIETGWYGDAGAFADGDLLD